MKENVMNIRKTAKMFRNFILVSLTVYGIWGAPAFSQPEQQKAQVTISYLPRTLIAAERGDKEIAVELEQIFMETTGVGVRFDQIKRTFIIFNTK